MPLIRLLPNEKLIYKANPHFIFLLGPMAGLVFCWLILWLGLCPFFEIFSLKSLCHFIVSIIILFSISVIYLDWHFDRLYITNYRIIKERGIIGKKYTSIWLAKIQDVICQFGFWGRVFGYGDIIIESAGTFGQVNIKGFSEPEKTKGLIEEEMQKNREGIGGC